VLTPLGSLLDAARERPAAVGAFTVYTLEQAVAVARTAERRDAGVVMLLSDAAFRAPNGDLLAAAVVAIAARSRVPVCVQLDHVSDLERMRRALELGAGALMADGARLPYEENVALVRAAVELARAHDAVVEAELGHITGDEEIAHAVAAGALTDPDQASDFVSRTGASCLAVSIGNVHGRYREPPALDLERLAALRRRVPVALSLHGASGLPDALIDAAIRGGVAKINVNTELREQWFAAVAHHAPAHRDGLRLLALQERIVDSVAARVDSRLAAFERGAAVEPA